MVTPWRRWWRFGQRSGEISPDPDLARSHQIWQPTPRHGKNPRLTVEIEPPWHGKNPRSTVEINGGDRTTPAVEFTTEVSFCETEKKMREGKGDGGREEWGRGGKNEKKMRGERISELYESFVKSKELAGYWSGISGRVRLGK